MKKKITKFLKIMATIDLSILEAALADGFIGKKLSANEKLYLAQSVTTVNRILEIVKANQEIDSDQLTRRMRMSKNTCLIYCRWLLAKNLIRKSPIPYRGTYGAQALNVYQTVTY